MKANNFNQAIIAIAMMLIGWLPSLAHNTTEASIFFRMDQVTLKTNGIIDNYGNPQIEGFTYDFVDIVISKGTGINDPIYNNDNQDIRIYSSGTITLTTENESKLKKVVFSIPSSGNGQKRLASITASTGKVELDNSAWTVTWTGEASEITLTISERAEWGSELEKTGRFVFSAMEVTSAEDEHLHKTTMEFSYCGNVFDHIGFPDSNESRIKGLIQIPQDVAAKYSGAKISKVLIAVGSADFYDSSIYFSRDISDEQNIYSQKCELLPNIWNEIPVDTSFEIDSCGFIVGFQSTAKPYAYNYIFAIDDKIADKCGGYVGKYNGDKWEYFNLRDNKLGNLCIRLILEGENLPQYDLELQNIIVNEYVNVNETFSVRGFVKNYGAQEVNSYNVKCQIGDNEPFTTKITSIDSNNINEFEIDGVVINDKGNFNLTVTIEKPNGYIDEYFTNNVLEKQVKSNNYFKRKVLLEQFGSVRCPNTSYWNEHVDNIVNDRMDMIRVAHYIDWGNDKTFVTPTSREIESFFKLQSTPSYMLDRTNLEDIGAKSDKLLYESPIFLFNDDANFKKLVDYQTNQPGIVSININHTYNELTRELTVKVYGKAIEDFNETTFLNLFLTESNIVGYQAEFAGDNNYYLHNNIHRISITPTWGNKITYNEDGTYEMIFTSVLQNAWVPENIDIIAFICEYNTSNLNQNRVYNTESVRLKEYINIQLDKSEIELHVSDTTKLNAKFYPETSNKPVEWSSSNEAVAIVDANGVVIAIALGEAVITATTTDGSDLSASCKVTVVPTLAESIVLDKDEVTIIVPNSTTLVATILPELATDKSVVWSSSDESVAIVDEDGVITAVSSGQAVITATTIDGSNLSASCNANIIQLAESITLNEVDVKLEVTETTTLTATILPETTSDKNVVWTSSDKSVAVVDENGVVTAMGLGETVITVATLDGTDLSATCRVEVVPTLAESITLDLVEITLKATGTATLVATVLPELATDKSVKWSSSDETVAIVDKNGVVTAISVGEATITATTADGSDLSASCKVTVVPTLAESITLDKTDYEIVEKSDFQLVATVLPELTTNKGVVWSSSDMWVASVDENGLVRAYSVGEAIITATTVDGSNLSASCKVTVVSSLAQSITLDKTEVSLKATETATLVATVFPETTSNKGVEWTSSDESVAIVSKKGVVSAIAVGEATITATTTDGTNLSASCKVAVVPTLAESIALDKTEISLEATETATLIATVLPELTTDKSVEWSSSDETVAVVDENGVVTAVAVGEATITATTVDGSNLSASCKVTVVPTLAVSIELDQTEASVEEKSEFQLTATILPEHTTNKEVAWSSSDKWVATVDNYGLVTMYSAGEVIITATTTDGSNLSATCRINVYSGIDGVNGDDVIVATVGDNIVVKNAKLGSVVNVYASNGALVTSEEATDGSVVVEAPVKGVYVVKVGKQTVKVII